MLSAQLAQPERITENPGVSWFGVAVQGYNARTGHRPKISAPPTARRAEQSRPHGGDCARPRTVSEKSMSSDKIGQAGAVQAMPNHAACCDPANEPGTQPLGTTLLQLLVRILAVRDGLSTVKLSNGPHIEHVSV